MNKVIVNMGNFKLDEIPLHRGTLSIGRASDNDISLADNATSSHHAKIVTIFTSSFIQDLNSTNGTFVNGRRIVRHTLHHGDIIAIGNLQLLFKSDATDVTPVASESDQKTLMINKDEINAMLKSSKAGGASPTLPAGNATGLSGFALPNTNNGKPKGDDDIPTLDETLPLGELRRDAAHTAVAQTPGNQNVTSETNTPPQPKETGTARPAPKVAEQKNEQRPRPGTSDDQQDSTAETRAIEDNFDQELDDAHITALLMGDDQNQKNRALKIIAIGVTIIAIGAVAAFLLL